MPDEPFYLPGGKPKEPKQPDRTDRKIDLEKRYDVYCSDYRGSTIIHRNVLFKGTRYLFAVPQGYPSRAMDGYIELEQPNHQSIFLGRYHILYFCEHGTELMVESPKNSQD